MKESDEASLHARSLFITWQTSFTHHLACAVSTRGKLGDPRHAVAGLEDAALTQFGKQVKEAVGGRVFIDLGMGDPVVSHMARTVAQAFGATEYIGVDIQVTDSVRTDEFPLLCRHFGPFRSTFVRNDIRSFLASAPVRVPSFIYISGIEPLDRTEPYAFRAVGYSADCMRILAAMDCYILTGYATFGFDPEYYGFSRIGASEFQTLYQKSV